MSNQGAYISVIARMLQYGQQIAANNKMIIESVKQILRDTLQIGDQVDSWDVSSPLLGVVVELDSIAVVSILTLFEEQFGIEINDEDISADTFATLGSLTHFLEKAM